MLHVGVKSRVRYHHKRKTSIFRYVSLRNYIATPNKNQFWFHNTNKVNVQLCYTITDQDDDPSIRTILLICKTQLRGSCVWHMLDWARRRFIRTDTSQYNRVSWNITMHVAMWRLIMWHMLIEHFILKTAGVGSGKILVWQTLRGMLSSCTILKTFLRAKMLLASHTLQHIRALRVCTIYQPEGRFESQTVRPSRNSGRGES